MKSKKKLRRFSLYNNIANFEAFWRAKTLAKTSYFWGVYVQKIELNSIEEETFRHIFSMNNCGCDYN